MTPPRKPAPTPARTIDDLARMSEAEFVTLLGGVFEHSPWVAEAAWDSRPFSSVADLHAVMVHAVQNAEPDVQLALIRSHPQLAGKEAREGSLTASSHAEQAAAGLTGCSAEQLARLSVLNTAYLQKFGFPFVLAVKKRKPAEILAIFESRLKNDSAVEFRQCLAEISIIALMRLTSLLESRPGSGRSPS